MRRNKRGGCLKTFGIGFVALMLLSSLGGDGGSTDTTQNFATTTTDNETEELSSEVEESIQAEESLAEEREAKEEEERLAREKEEERLAKEEEERLEQESIEAAEEWQEKLDNARTDVTYDNLMRTPDEYFGEDFEGVVFDGKAFKRKYKIIRADGSSKVYDTKSELSVAEDVSINAITKYCRHGGAIIKGRNKGCQFERVYEELEVEEA